MKKSRNFRFLFALLGAVGPLWMSQAQTTTFFSDNFSNGSTTNGLSVPGGTPTASSTSYDFVSTKNTSGNCTIAPNRLHVTLSTATTSGFVEAQALFATNPVSLNVNGDYIDIAVVFTNTSNTIFNGTGNGSALWLGLFNSGSTFGVQTNWPVPNAQLANSGLTTAQSSPFAAGNCQLWQGYVGQILSNSAPQIINRPIQNGTSTSSANQELLGNGVGSGAFVNPRTTFNTAGPVSNITLSTTAPYTLDLRITLTGQAVLTISNALFDGSGNILSSDVTTNVSGANFLTAAFDGLSVGVRSAGSSSLNPVVDISSILITGQSTVPTNPPTITQQPAPVLVTTNGSCAFSVTAIGDNTTYQWFRNGDQKLTNGVNISGAKSSQLVISPAGTADQFTGANNGYYCVVAQGPVPSLFTNTFTNTLTLIATTNLVWAGGSSTWDVNNTASWLDTNGNSQVFNYGQPVTLNDSGANNPEVTLSANYLSPSSVTVSGSTTYLVDGTGSIAGPCSLLDFSAARLSLNCVNTYTGGTLISNATAVVYLQNYGALSTGQVTLGQAGGSMEIVPAGSASSGIQGDVNVADNFTFLPDINGAFAIVMLGNLSGTSGKTLTISPAPANPDTNQIRVRLYGGSTTYNGNLALTDPNILFASYHASGTQTFNGVISGTGAFMEKGLTTVFNGPNTYSGGATPAQGAMGLGVSSVGTWPSLSSGPLGIGPILLTVDSGSSLTANGFIFATVPNLTLGNAIQNVSGTNNCTLDIGGSQNITLTGPFTLYGNDHSVMTAFPSRTLQVTNTALTTFTGVISDGGSNYGFNLTGNGVLALNNTETYGGNTTNVASGASTNKAATLLVNGQVGPGAVVIQTNATLGGTGTITGPVTIQALGTLTAGNQSVAGTQGIGTLHLGSSLTFLAGSTNFVQVNTSLGTPNTVVNVTGAVAYNGTLFAQNVGPALSVGNNFQIVNAGSESGNFTAIAGSPGPGLAWSFNPTTGVLSVIQGVVPFTVPPHISSITLSGTNLTVTGTNAQAGALYYLLTSTNLLIPVNRWVPVGTNIAPGANNFSFTITNAVNPNDPRQFYLFSSTNN